MDVVCHGTRYKLVHLREPIYQVYRQTDGALIGTIDIVHPQRCHSATARAEVGELRGVAKQIELELFA
jgi:hypothetical protein